MELTIASALSAEGLLGHAAYVLLVLSMLMRTLLWLRLLVIASALLGISYAVFILGDPVSTFWETCLVVVNIGQLLITHWRSLRARFSDDEAHFIARHLPGLTRGEARALIDRGRWVALEDGACLAVEGEPVERLSYVAEGAAEVRVGGRAVSACGAGDFVGEMTVLTGLPATATVVATAQTVVWQVEAPVLRDLTRRRDDLSRELEAAFARNYRDKIVAMNRRAVAGLGG
ncbi:cyclic nucleotide-binding domain-containing protein [Roseicyclus persicicus]|uniref:Cyclic nucleotide-binding domain-containing protein n=1 Tax=Roseicyclus persicicus TaxID=2650661 RepID=A0A7X6H1D8_9RHOB|nr:cyclic nucleotide-binding domain-containing protein [Roseibacterium persicicum]NKX46262.1 cyclic nucleotide-binding domain-containing protein [Roseibacterium persicicum]